MPTILNEFKIGAIAYAIKNRRKRSFSAIAREFKASPTTVREIANHGQGYRASARCKKRIASAKRSQAKLRQRRAVCLAGMKKKLNAFRSIPAYSSTKAISLQLVREGYVNVSPSTVRRDLRAAGMKSYVRPKTPFDALKHAAKRLSFANKGLWRGATKTVTFQNLIFADEVIVTANDKSARRQWAKSKRQTIPRTCHNRFNVPSLMLFAAVGVGYKSPLVIVDGKKDEDGKNVGLTAKRYTMMCLSKIKTHLQGAGRIFVQDNARCHIAQNVTNYLTNNKINFISDWPPYSPDLNPIETVWALLHHEVASAGGATTRQELETLVRRTWASLDQKKIDNIVLGFERKLTEVRATQGKVVIK